MKKLLSVILSFVLILSLVITAFAEETSEQLPPEEVPAECLMGDADGDSVITSDDARILLRASVKLETLAPEVLIRCDMDLMGDISASDARMALRTAVGLEEKVTHKFIVTQTQLSDCKTEGLVKARCVECEIEASVVVCTTPHKYQNEEIKCESEKLCLQCGETITQEKLVHTLSEQGKCIYCNYLDVDFVYGKVVDFVKRNGIVQDGIYLIQEDIPECSFALCFDSTDKTLYFMSGYYVATGADVVEVYTFLDVKKNFAGYTAELDAYQNGEFVLYGIYDVAPSKLSLDEPNALTEKKFEPADIDGTSREQIRIAAEANVIAIVAWANELFTRLGVPCNADIMGFTALDVESVGY